MRERFRRLAARLLRPLTARVDRRFARLDNRVADLHSAMGAWMSRSRESESHLGRSLASLRSDTEQQADEAAALTAEVVAIRSELGSLAVDLRSTLNRIDPTLGGGASASLALLDARSADFMNRATGYLGLTSQAGIFVNEPVITSYSEGAVRVTDVNERIVEMPFIFRESARLPPGSSIIDVGSSESTVSLSLAGLGHAVTAVDPRGYAFAHPLVTEFHGRLEEYPGEDVFDAAVLLSTIEHVGIEHYGQSAGSDADFALVRTLRILVKPGGFLFLTTPYGRPEVTDFQRIYDEPRLELLLDGWQLVSCIVAAQTGPTVWEVTDAALGPVEDDVYRVVMIVAQRPVESGSHG